MWLIHPVVPPRSVWLVKLPEAPLLPTICQAPVSSLPALFGPDPRCHGHWARYRQRPTSTETQDPTSSQDKVSREGGFITVTPASQYLGVVDLVGEAGVTLEHGGHVVLATASSHKLSRLLGVGSIRTPACQLSDMLCCLLLPCTAGGNGANISLSPRWSANYRYCVLLARILYTVSSVVCGSSRGNIFPPISPPDRRNECPSTSPRSSEVASIGLCRGLSTACVHIPGQIATGIRRVSRRRGRPPGDERRRIPLPSAQVGQKPLHLSVWHLLTPFVDVSDRQASQLQTKTKCDAKIQLRALRRRSSTGILHQGFGVALQSKNQT